MADKNQLAKGTNGFYALIKVGLAIITVFMTAIAGLSTAAVIGIFSMVRSVSSLETNFKNMDTRLERIERNIDEKRSEQRTQ